MPCTIFIQALDSTDCKKLIKSNWSSMINFLTKPVRVSRNFFKLAIYRLHNGHYYFGIPPMPAAAWIRELNEALEDLLIH